MTEEMVKMDEEIVETCEPAKSLEQVIAEIGAASELPSLEGKTFVLAEVKNAEALKERIAQEGGQVKDTTILATDYVILGDNSKGETAKVKKALELNQTRGKSIQAMKESDFWLLLEKRDAEAAETRKRLEEEAAEAARQAELARIAEEERLRKEAEEQKRLEEEAAAKARELELARIAMEERLRREEEEKKRREEYAEAMRLYEVARADWVAVKIQVEEQRQQALQEAKADLRVRLKEENRQWYLDAMKELSAKTATARKTLLAEEDKLAKLRIFEIAKRVKCKRAIQKAEKTWADMPEETQRLRATYQRKKAELDRTLQSYEEQLIAQIETQFPLPPAPQMPQE